MNSILLVFTLAISSFLFWLNPQQASFHNVAFRNHGCDSIPEINRQIVNFVKSNLNKKVGRGECWDLAAQALNKVAAKWDKNYVFGKEVDLKTECVYPGDIIQFEGVEVEYEKNKVFYKEKLAHHTAVIYQVRDKENFTLAEQNTTLLGKKVGLSSLNLKNIRKGEYKIFRPYK